MGHHAGHMCWHSIRSILTVSGNKVPQVAVHTFVAEGHETLAHLLLLLLIIVVVLALIIIVLIILITITVSFIHYYYYHKYALLC